MNKDEIPSYAIYSVLDLIKPGEIACEIGVRSGQSSFALLNKGCFVYMIDPWEEYEEYTESKAYRFEEDYENVLKMVNEFPNQYKIIRKKSDDTLNDVPNNLSLVYIDGNHVHDFVLRDMNNYWPKIRSGGWLTGDDISMEGVAKAVVEFYFEKRKECPDLRLEYHGRNWAIQKP